MSNKNKNKQNQTTSNETIVNDVVVNDVVETTQQLPTFQLFPKSYRKLSNDIALQILQMLHDGQKASAIAKMYDVDSSTISDIKVGRLYKHALTQFTKQKHDEFIASQTIEQTNQ